MQDNTIPSKEDGWNSDEAAFPGLSCEQLARFLSAFTSAFRAFLLEDTKNGPVGVLKMVRKLIDAQITVLESGQLSEENQKFANDHVQLGILAIGSAMAATSETDPRTLAELSNRAVELLTQLVDKYGVEVVEASHIHFSVKNNEEKAEPGISAIKVGVALVPMAEMEAVLRKDKQAGQVLRLVKSMPQDNGQN